MYHQHRAKTLILSGVLALGSLAGIAAIAAPAGASNIYPGPIFIDPYSVSLYSFNDCQSVEVLAGPGLPAFNYQSGGVGGWIDLWKVAPNGTEVDSGGAVTSAIPGYVLWGDNHASSVSRRICGTHLGR